MVPVLSFFLCSFSSEARAGLCFIFQLIENEPMCIRPDTLPLNFVWMDIYCSSPSLGIAIARASLWTHWRRIDRHEGTDIQAGIETDMEAQIDRQEWSDTGHKYTHIYIKNLLLQKLISKIKKESRC